jgi:hypothetical protein
MNAFDMISEPVLFAQELREYSSRVHHSVELIQSLADALLAEDCDKIQTLHEQMSRITGEADQSKLSLYDQIKGMHFHSAGGDRLHRCRCTELARRDPGDHRRQGPGQAT